MSQQGFRERDVTWGRGMGHALLMGPSRGVPGTCFSYEFALDFRRVPLCHLHPRSTQEQCCFCLWARAHPRAGSGQLLSLWSPLCSRDT